MKNKGLAVICDFDGTISIEDVNSSIANKYGTGNMDSVYKDYKDSKIGLRECLYLEYKDVALSSEEFNKFVKEEIKIDKTFFQFYRYAKRNNILVAIVSGGFKNYVDILFRIHGQAVDMPVYSNLLQDKDGILLPEFNEKPECIKTYGPCGVCKYKRIIEYKKDYNVIFVGDGLTDRCAALNADIVFAKEGLALQDFCEENNIHYKAYNNFRDIQNYIEKYMRNN